MIPIVLFIQASESASIFYIHALETIGFQVVHLHPNEIPMLPKEECSKTDVLIIDLNKPLNILHPTELVENDHPSVHIYKKISPLCAKNHVVFFTSPESDTIEDFGLTRDSIASPFECICTMKVLPSEFKKRVRELYFRDTGPLSRAS
jgi:hypothetical protein